MVNIKPEEMINGEIYYIDSTYDWIMRFNHIDIYNGIWGYTVLCDTAGSFYRNNWIKMIDITSIRLVTAIERDRLINEEIKNGFIWAGNVPCETIIQIY